MFIFERERDRVWAGEGQREKGRHRIQSSLQVLSCQHRARHGARTHELWDHDLSWSWMLNLLSHLGAPIHLFFILQFFFKFFFSTFIYFWDRERQSMNGGGAEREGDTESEAGSRPWAVGTEPDMGLELMNCEITTWVEIGCLTD